MRVYLVWVSASYCDYGVVNILQTREEAEKFIKSANIRELVDHYSELDIHDFSIEEREIGVPVKQKF